MKKIFALMALVVVSLGVLFLFDGAGEANAPEYYFRDNQTLSGKIAVSLNTSVQWRKLSDRQEEVLEMLPEMYGFDSFSCWGRYDDEDIYGIQLDWIYTEAENYQSVSMYLFPEAPDKYGKVDGMYNLDYEHVTVTERDGVTIYGDGTSDSTARVLEMVLEDGTYCQIVNRCAEGVLASLDSLEAMRELVDFLLENDLAFDDFLVLEAMAE